jgi:formamidopyrimidine-DNA glycosylase
MTGWLYIRGEPSIHYRPKESDEIEVWPPKFWKFAVETQEEPKVEAAFTDVRRFARIRLLDCTAEKIRMTTPLKENGPDPVIDKDILTEEWLVKKMNSKHIPVKALLLDQANISGIGNWVGSVLSVSITLKTVTKICQGRSVVSCKTPSRTV